MSVCYTLTVKCKNTNMKPSFLNINLNVLRDCGKSAAIAQAYIFLYKDYLAPILGNSSRMGELLGIHRETYKEALITLKEHGYIERDELGQIVLTEKSIISKEIPLEGKIHAPAFISANIDQIEELGIYPAVLLGMVVLYTGNGGNFYLKNKTIARVLGISTKTVTRSIALLENKGYIEVFRITQEGAVVARYIKPSKLCIEQYRKPNPARRIKTEREVPEVQEPPQTPTPKQEDNSTHIKQITESFKIYSTYQHTPVKLPQKKEPEEIITTRLSELKIHQVITPLYRMGALRIPEGTNSFKLITMFQERFEPLWAIATDKYPPIEHPKSQSWVRYLDEKQLIELGRIAEGIFQTLTNKPPREE